jgi:hypothetical protein
VTGAYWITNVPQATGVSNSVSPNTIYMGSSAAVNVWGAVCPPGTFPVYSTVDSRGNPHSGSFTDSPPSTGTWTYATTASCKGPDAAGAASVPARAYLTVINPPPPNWAGSNPSGMFSSCYANSVQVTGFWTNVTNATSFSGTSYVTVLGVTYSAPASVSYSGGQWISSSAFNGFSAFQVTASHIDVTASGAGGSTFQQITASYSTC